MNAVYKIYDMSKQGMAKGAMIAILHDGSMSGQQIGSSVDSCNLQEVHDSAQQVAKSEGYSHAEYVGYKIEAM